MTHEELQKKSSSLTSENTSKFSRSETIEKDQDELMTTLESIRGLLEQSENKLNAARESISIANTTTQNDTSALHNMRSFDDEIVPVLDQVIQPEEQTDSFLNIPELAPIVASSDIQTTINVEEKIKAKPKTQTKVDERSEETRASLAILTKKNLLLDALDNFQTELEESLREELMKTMVSLEKDLKKKISIKIENIKDEIFN